MINTAIIMGRLSRDPELRTTQSGISVCRFTVACDRPYSRQGDDQKTKADFIEVTAWRQTADFVSKFFHKGSMIAVEGSIQVETYTDRENVKRKDVRIIASNVSFCGSKAEGNTLPKVQDTQPQPSYSSAGGDDFEEIVDDEDDLPF